MEPWQDLDEAMGSAARDPALELVLGALVEMTDHAQIAVVGLIDQVDGKGVVGDVQIDVLFVEVIDHLRAGFAHSVGVGGRGDPDREIDVGAFVEDADVPVAQA